MIRYIGDNMLGGTGFALTLILAATVLIALIGTTLACLNTGVRITYVMGRDKEMPSILGLLHGKYATPHYGVLALAVVSMAFGALRRTFVRTTSPRSCWPPTPAPSWSTG